jgi:hypothetical protein
MIRINGWPLRCCFPFAREVGSQNSSHSSQKRRKTRFGTNGTAFRYLVSAREQTGLKATTASQQKSAKSHHLASAFIGARHVRLGPI